MTANTTSIIRACPSTVIVWSVLSSPLPIAGITTILAPTHQEWIGVIFCALYPVVVYWASSPEVHLSGNTLTYKTLHSKRSIQVDRVMRVDVVVTPAPVLRLFTSPHAQPFEFIIKPFSKSGVSFIIHHIRSIAPQAKFNPLSQELEQGDFGAVAREMLKTGSLVRLAITTGAVIFAVSLAHALRH